MMTMPRSLQEILDQADALAARFETYDGPIIEQDTDALRRVAAASSARAAAERELGEAVAAARAAGCAWAAIAVFLGTSGEAARQRYGASAPVAAARVAATKAVPAKAVPVTKVKVAAAAKAAAAKTLPPARAAAPAKKTAAPRQSSPTRGQFAPAASLEPTPAKRAGKKATGKSAVKAKTATKATRSARTGTFRTTGDSSRRTS